MTGEKNRYKTLDKMWKLDDEQLKTPKHDEMVLYLLNKDVIKELFKDELQKCIDKSDNPEISLEEVLSERDINIVSEDPILAPNKFLVGYWDIRVDYPIPIHDSRIYKGINYTYIWSFFIEVKPTITSFGATLRQLRTYQTYVHPNAQVYLFTEDLRFKDAFESQGINVISPPERQSDLGI